MVQLLILYWPIVLLALVLLPGEIHGMPSSDAGETVLETRFVGSQKLINENVQALTLIGLSWSSLHEDGKYVEGRAILWVIGVT